MNLSGSPLDFVLAFLGGVAISFTPCVYPLIPITAGYIGASSAGSRFKGFRLSLVYVTGLAVTYSFLGLFASLTGAFFGRVSSHPVTYFVVGLIVILFGLSMLDLFMIPLPNFIKLPKFKRKGYFSAFVLGLSSGFLASPCLTPALGAILAYLTTKKNLVYGMLLLFCFGYGMGAVLILVGTFSAQLVNLPKSGKLMGYFKKASSLAVIGMGLFLIYNGIRRM
ncbi:MAG: sulfite exporter TauE/SafE family protein [Candidatus Omnitrophica bacterium]|nr:sulfite exporter TauE/SafE family protein [Candidatus Omnitrophota bacterium]